MNGNFWLNLALHRMSALSHEQPYNIVVILVDERRLPDAYRSFSW